MYGTRTETITRKEVRHVRTVNGKVVQDDFDQQTDRDIEFNPGKRSYQAITGVFPNAIQNGSPRKPKEMVFETETEVQHAPRGSFDDDRPIKLPIKTFNISDGSESSGHDFADAPPQAAGVSARSGYSSDRDVPRRRSSSGSSGGLKSASVTLPMKTNTLTRRGTPSPVGGRVNYNIALKIGEVKGDGANGNVYIQLFGANGDSPKINLRQAGDEQHAFKEGDLYRFTVSDTDIGKIDRIKLSHDHMDYGSGFFVEEVEVEIPSRHDSYKFPCNFWLSQERHQRPSRNSTSEPHNAKLYNVSMQLGRVMNPYAKLFLQLCGDEGDSSKIVLRPTGGPTDTFQEGKVYKFSVEMPSVGKVDKIRIGHESRGRNKGIYVDEVEVTPEDEETVFFPCGCWLAEDMADGKLEREVHMGHAPAPIGTDATHTVSVRLGEVLNYNAQLYIYMVGVRGETSKVPLRPEGLLERTKTYQFPLALNVDIGKIERIILGQNSRGYGKGLFVEEVNIQPTGGVNINFPCQCWLAEDVWDSEIERELFPGVPVKKAPNTTYELTFKTGDKPHAGTDANVTLQIFGEHGQTEKIMLRQSGRLNTLKRFDRGRTDRFDVQTLNVGKLTKIRLSHDNSNPDPEWFLDKLTISIPDIGETYHFPVDRWLTGDEADALVEMEMEPTLVEPIVVVEKELPVQSGIEFTDLEPPKVLYTVSFRLGPMLDPYTRVYLIFHGENGDSEKIYLNPPNGQELETDKVYKVITEAPDVGQIHSATIGHDSPGPDKGVFMEEFDISAPAEKPVVFPSRCWLAEDVDDGATERTLRPGETLTYPYEITFTIGEVIDPRCKLYMMIYGTKGDSGKLYLSPSDGSEFVKGRTYKVIADIRDIGDIDEIRLGQEGDRGLFVEGVDVKGPDVDPVIFPCRCWLDSHIDDGKTSRVLRPGETVTFPYEITFTLGDVDPDAQLYMIICGTEGDSGKLYLTPSDGSKFVKGQTYRVIVDVPDIGNIEKIRLGQEGSDKGVFVEEVEIRAPGKDPLLFPCRCWIVDQERELAPNETITPLEDSTLYNATFETGDVPFAGTDATVFLQMFGTDGNTDKIEFPQDDDQLRFEKGRTDKFAVETVDIGDLTKVRVGHDNKGHSPEWFLKQLTIDVPSKNKRYVFPFNNWIAGEDVDLEPVDEKSRAELYTILLKLGDVLDPHTPVLVQLIGEKGESGKIQVKPGVRPTDKFEKGKIYKLIAKVGDIGRIKDVLVTQDESIPSEGLFVEEVEVTSSQGETQVFPVRCWTCPEKDGKDMLYDVTFKTGVLPNSGTSANVFFQIHGDEESTEEIQLQEDKSLNLFETGGTDKFTVETKSVGKITRLRVGHDNTGPSPDWYLQKVNIDVPDKDEHYQFNFNQWIRGDNPEVEVAAAPDRSDKLQDLDYRITVKTGDDLKAGTDSNVFLQMFGDEGQSSKFLLREEGDSTRFTRGKLDKFVIRNKDLGTLERIYVHRDDAGSRAGWQLDYVKIDIPEKDEHYLFRCNRWLTATHPDAEFAGERVSEKEGMYTVVCKAGDVLDPGVSPYFQIFGDEGETGRIMLRDGYPSQHVFKKGNTYKVSLKSPEVGEITKLRLGDDGGGRGRTIFVEEVSVIDKNGDEVVFPCHCWLGTDDDGRPIIREVAPGETVPDDVDDIFYHMTIITADEPGAGTDSTVYFRLYGEKGETSDIVLEDERNKSFKKFERGRADKFVVQTADVGKLQRMVIGHNNSGDDPSWLLEEVHVDIPSRNEHYVFRCGKWLKVNNGKDETETVLYPDPEDKRVPVDDRIEGVIDDQLLQGAMNDEDLFGEPTELDYKIDITTADQSNAGTHAGADFQLLGERGETDKIFLGHNDDGQHFQPGQTDTFNTHGKDVGKLQYFRIGNDGRNASPDWLIDQVEVYVPERNERYVFKNNKWIDNRDNPIDIPLHSFSHCQLVGKEPTIPDLLEFMQSGDSTKATHAAFYLQHLTYNNESVKNEVRELKGIPIIVDCLYHSNENVRYGAACVLRNLSYSSESDVNKIAIADGSRDHGGIEALVDMLQRTSKQEHRAAALVVLRNLSVLESLRLKILRLCLHILVIVIIKIFSGWDKTKAQREPEKSNEQWSELLEHATRIVRNVSSAGIDAREAIRFEEHLIDCLVWIVRVGVKNKRYDDKCVENSVCVLRNLSYRLESELDRDIYDDAEVQLDKATVKEQQSQGCFAGCGGRKKKKSKSNIPMDKQSRKGPPTGPALLYQPTTVRQYFVLLRSSKNPETLEGSAGAIHNLTACSWKWAIKIRGDTRREQAIPHIISLLRTDYDPTIRASAIALRNLSVDPENKRIIGEKGTGPLVNRLPQGDERSPRLVKDATVVSLLCALFQLGKKSEKNARTLKKTTGIRRMVKIAKSNNNEATKNKYDERVVRTANQTLASLWPHEVLKQQMKSEGWEYNANNKSLEVDFPEEFDKVSQPPTPSGSLNRRREDDTGSFSNKDPELHRIQRQPELYQRSPSSDQGYRKYPSNSGSTAGHSSRAGSTSGSQADFGSEWSGRQRSWGEAINSVPPPPYQSDDNRSGKDFIEMSDRSKPPIGMKNEQPKRNDLVQDNPNDWV